VYLRPQLIFFFFFFRKREHQDLKIITHHNYLQREVAGTRTRTTRAVVVSVLVDAVEEGEMAGVGR
jgi:hypothetical protein